MVNKIAIMALVGILAVPILLGYGLNLSEVSVTEYRTEGDPVNVTPLLQNGTGYTPAHADVYRLDANIMNAYYESVGTTATSYYINNGQQTGYVDFAAGFHLVAPDAQSAYTGSINLPLQTQSVIITINLDSVSASDYSFRVIFRQFANNILFEKETVDGIINWSVKGYATGSGEYDLYYDSTRSDNTYQILITTSNLMDAPNNNQRYSTTYSIRYVGSWPTLIGAANYFQEYTIMQNTTVTTSTVVDELSISRVTGPTNRSNTIRLDDALFNGMEYPIIKDKAYVPADFRSNPSTTITNISKYGQSIRFAGITYPVGPDGNITLGTHKTSVNRIVFDSVPVAVGYENRINGSVVNVSADPAIIEFNGEWSASITTTGQAATIYTQTEWAPGQFAWNGIDDNFLIVGLITCLGVFIALGMYARSHRASIWPVLLICGGAAVLFIFMV